MDTVKVDVKSAEKASRLELFIRIVWMIPTMVVLWVFSLVASICMVIHWFFILITGRRNNTLNDVVKKYMYYITKVNGYMTLLTDERNPILPED